MPVLEFAGEESFVFKILLDHFNRIWDTTTEDAFHMDLQYARKNDIIRDNIFAVRMQWLKTVCATLQDVHARGRHPRQSYPFEQRLTMSRENGMAIAAKLVECSLSEICIDVAAADHAVAHGEKVTFSIPGDSWTDFETRINKHLFAGNCHYEVRNILPLASGEFRIELFRPAQPGQPQPAPHAPNSANAAAFDPTGQAKPNE
jgi:hypothetical protein